MIRIPTRVKVVLAKNQLVVPVGNPNDKVERLVRDIAQRFEGYGVKSGELRLATLKTVDGFEINQNDMIKDVIEHTETLLAVDYDEWIEQQKGMCNTVWASIVREDYEDTKNSHKWIQIGLHDLNKLFVKFGVQYPGSKSEKVLGLELFDTEALQHYAKEGKVLLGSKEGENWKIEAFFIVKNGTVQELEFSVKTASDQKPVIQRLQIKIGRKLEKGNLTVIQSNSDDYDPTTYKLPPPSKTGGSLPEPPAEPEKKTPKTIVSTGDCSLVVTMKGEIETDQSNASDGKFFNWFNHNFGLLNNSDEKLAITKVYSEYLNSKNEWVAANTRIGSRGGFYNYSWNRDESTHFNMNGKDQRDLAVQVAIQVTGRQFQRNRRAHFSLPQPMKMRITFIDSANKKSVILTEQENGPVDVATRAEREKRHGKPFYFWDQCDDTETEARFWTEASWNEKDQRIEIYYGTGNKGSYVNLNTLKRLAYKGVKEKTEAVEFDDSFKEGGCSVKLYAMVDLKTQRPYGIKSEISTPTSSSVAYFHIPKYKI